MRTIPPEQELRAAYTESTDEALRERYRGSPATLRRWRRHYRIPSHHRGPRTPGISNQSISDEAIAQAVKASYSVAGALRFLGLREAGGNHRTMKERIVRLHLDTSHFGHQEPVLGTQYRTLPIEEYLVRGRRTKTCRLKRRLIKEGLLVECCDECGLGTTWNNKPLVLHLDHKDGNPTNNNLSNLHLLCPNCHSQTPTYTGRNIGKNCGTIEH